MAELFVLPLSRDGHPNREPIQVTFWNGWTGAPAWTPDGGQIIYGLRMAAVSSSIRTLKANSNSIRSARMEGSRGA